MLLESDHLPVFENNKSINARFHISTTPKLDVSILFKLLDIEVGFLASMPASLASPGT